MAAGGEDSLDLIKPLQEAIRGQHSEVVSLLFANGADPRCRDDEGNNSLHLVAKVRTSLSCRGNGGSATVDLEHRQAVRRTSTDVTPTSSARRMKKRRLIILLRRKCITVNDAHEHV